MLRVLITGMSGTGKSTVVRELAARGHRAVDADTDQWSHWGPGEDGALEWVWREDAMGRLLAGHRHGKLFVAGCAWNQGRFHPWFSEIVLLTAPVEVILQRLDTRTTNTFGKTPQERAQVLRDLAEVQPRLRAAATVELDTRAPLSDVVDRIDRLPERLPEPG